MGPSEQKALVLETAGSPLVINTQWPLPNPKPGQVLVKVLATALNPVDWKIQVYKLPFLSYPGILGTDAAGEVVALGEGVTNLKPGDRILWQGFFDNNRATFQQYSLAHASRTAKVPANVSLDEAASIPLGLATAWLGLYNANKDGQGGGTALEPFWKPGYSAKYNGKPFVLLGGATSVGQYVIQLAKLAGFSPIIATASAHNTALLTSLGATHVLARTLAASELEAEVTKITSSPISIVYDAVSLPHTLTTAWALLAPGGQLVHLSQLPKEIKAGQDGKELAFVMGNVHMPGQDALGAELYAHLGDWLKDGSIKPNPVQVLPNGLAGIPDGLKLLQEHKVSGKKLIAHPHD